VIRGELPERFARHDEARHRSDLPRGIVLRHRADLLDQIADEGKPEEPEGEHPVRHRAELGAAGDRQCEEDGPFEEDEREPDLELLGCESGAKCGDRQHSPREEGEVSRHHDPVSQPLSEHDVPAPDRPHRDRLDDARGDLPRERVHGEEDGGHDGQEVRREESREGEHVEEDAPLDERHPVPLSAHHEVETKAVEREEPRSGDQDGHEDPFPEGLVQREARDGEKSAHPGL